MMPPLIVKIHVLVRHGRSLRLWIPLFLLWILLLPFALVVLPALFILCVVTDVDPFVAMTAVLSLLASLSGMHIEVDTPHAFVYFHIV